MNDEYKNSYRSKSTEHSYKIIFILIKTKKYHSATWTLLAWAHTSKAAYYRLQKYNVNLRVVWNS